MNFSNLILTKTESNIITIKRKTLPDEIRYWILYNLMYPLIVIFIPGLLALFTEYYIKSFWEIIFNGGLTLIGINILAGMASFLRRSEDFLEASDIDEIKKNLELEKTVQKMRSKLILIAYILGIIGTGLYIIQLAYEINKFSPITTIILFILVILILSFSTQIGKMLFVLSTEYLKEEAAFNLLFKQLDDDKKRTNDLIDQVREELQDGK
ncbi:MAG: hypothetical protein BroJett005_11500 [Ignavibacteriota bacterium]|nr:MAG: hypothetical protein BroJett005_11500 [Ignavibacteriota bacterium]